MGAKAWACGSVLVVMITVLSGCHLLPGRDDFSDEAVIVNRTDQPLVIYWFDETGHEERIFELPPRPPGATIDLPVCDPRGLVARTVSGEEIARSDGPTCGGWGITDGD